MKNVKFTNIYPWMMAIEGIETKDELYMFAALYALSKFNGYGFVKSSDEQLAEYFQIDACSATKAIESLISKGLVNTYTNDPFRFFFVDLKKFSGLSTNEQTA